MRTCVGLLEEILFLLKCEEEINQVGDRDCAGRMFQAGEKSPAECYVLGVDKNLWGQAVLR